MKIQTKVGEIDYNFNLNDADETYHNLFLDILTKGAWKENRTGTRTLSLFGPQLVFDLNNGFPLISTKKIHWKSIVGELLWFLSGSTNKHELKEKYGVSIWDEWGDDKTGELGPVYGKQWVEWETGDIFHYEGPNGQIIDEPITINQIQKLVDKLKTNPDDRRLIVSAWNVAQIDQMALPPCHWSFQCYTSLDEQNRRELSMIMNIRSWDTFLGGPFNIAEYALLLMMLAQQTDMIPRKLIINAGDAHIYEDHIPYIIEQLKRNSESIATVELIKAPNIFSYSPKDIILSGYKAHPNWKNVPVAV